LIRSGQPAKTKLMNPTETNGQAPFVAKENKNASAQFTFLAGGGEMADRISVV
jgi:hypothetical protein